jgi:hypothetical protein
MNTKAMRSEIQNIKNGISFIETNDDALLRVLDAMSRVLSSLVSKVEEQESSITSAANIASCLANGIIPD